MAGKKRRSSARRHRQRSNRSRSHRRFDRNRVALWFAVVLVALLSVIFLNALVRQDTDLMDMVLPVLLAALKLALKRALKEAGKK